MLLHDTSTVVITLCVESVLMELVPRVQISCDKAVPYAGDMVGGEQAKSLPFC